jgi:uncharacterized damage-inducible protein DinB
MIDVAYATTMARYNRWQNESLYGAAATLEDAARRADRGAFFKSIHGTLCHVLWGDGMWMHRFHDTPKPAVGIAESPEMAADWETLCAERRAFDKVIEDWAAALDPEWLAGDLTWFSVAENRRFTGPKALLVVHMFNHQTHHRGQVHAMLTAAGARPDVTDLISLRPRQLTDK